MELLHEESGHLLMERPEKARRTNLQDKEPNQCHDSKKDEIFSSAELLSTETQSEASCRYSVRSHKPGSTRRKTPGEQQRRTKAEEKNAKKGNGHGKRRKTSRRWLGMKDFLKRYTLEKQLEGGCRDRVHAGVRKSDGEKVAIKYLLKETAEYFTLPGVARSLPLEAVLMERVSKPRCSPYVIKLLEWFETPRGFLLIIERPHQFIPLHKFRQCLQGKMSEDLSRTIVCRVGWAALHCRDNGVLHRDIQEKNILLNPETLELKLIDFGNAFLLEDGPYRAFGGPLISLPTQWIVKEFWPEPATIWDLGVLLYTLTCGEMPLCYRSPLVISGLSEACSRLINWCLQRDIEKRPTFEQFLWHDWFYDKAFS